jgi:L-2,4-diaminobutyrate transaminase
MKENMANLMAKDAEVLLHPASSITALLANGPDMITSAKGSTVTDANGRELLDAVGGLWCVNVGYGRKELADAMQQAAQQISYYHTFSNASNPWQVALAEKLLSKAPEQMTKVFFGSSGSDANDTIIKLVWHYFALKGQHSKIKMIAREQGYHGTSISTASLTGLGGFHKEFPLPLDFVLRTECPHFYTRGKAGETEEQFCDRLIDEVAQLIEREGAENIGAFFAEPIHAAGGVIEPPKGYYPKLQKLLKANDILLVADEVVCGYGRLGKWFGSQVLDIEPDFMATAKGLTSGYFPMSAVFMTQDIWEVMKLGSEKLGAFSHGYTYSGHPIGAAVALANLEIIEKEGLVELAGETGAYLHEQLQAVLGDHPHVAEIRGRGLIAGVQLVEDKVNKVLPDPAEKWPLKVANACREAGVIVRPLPSVGTLAISPPLVITRDEVDQLVSVLKQSIDSVTSNS